MHTKFVHEFIWQHYLWQLKGETMSTDRWMDKENVSGSFKRKFAINKKEWRIVIHLYSTALKLAEFGTLFILTQKSDLVLIISLVHDKEARMCWCQLSQDSLWSLAKPICLVLVPLGTNSWPVLKHHCVETHYKQGELWKYHAEWKKSVTKGHVLHGSAYLQYLM